MRLIQHDKEKNEFLLFFNPLLPVSISLKILLQANEKTDETWRSLLRHTKYSKYPEFAMRSLYKSLKLII